MGGQSINAFDYAMAEGVRKSFKKIIKAEVARACEFCEISPAAEVDFKICTYSEGDNPAAVENLTAVVGSKKLAEKIYRQACRDVEEETHQAMEALIHNFNTLHCLPYSEKIWVFDTAQNELELTAVGELAEKFELNRYQAISLNKNTGATELKFITAIERKDNHRNLVTLVDNAGRRVTVTDNHKVLYKDSDGKIREDIPAKIPNVVTVQKFDDGECSFNFTYSVSEIKEKIPSNSGEEYVYDLAVEDNETFLTKDCIFVHNSRAGAQVGCLSA